MSDKLRVLIVEDNPADADFIREILPETGPLSFQIESVSRLSAALTRLESKGIDLVLLDLGLPDSQGLQTLHKLREAAPEVPVIVLTGTDDQELALTALRDGAQDYLVKGQFNRSLLIRTARYAVERQKAEAGARESEERHRTLLQTAMDGFWLVDMQGRLLEVNETYCRMSGYSAPELLAMRIPDLEANETANDTAAHTQKVMAQGEDRFESRHRRKDGSLFDVEVSVQHRPTEGGQMVAFLQDITERKRTEVALRQQAEELLASNDRLNRFNRAAVGRELRMIELKREVNELCRKLGEPPRHHIVGDETVLPAAPETQA